MMPLYYKSEEESEAESRPLLPISSKEENSIPYGSRWTMGGSLASSCGVYGVEKRNFLRYQRCLKVIVMLVLSAVAFTALFYMRQVHGLSATDPAIRLAEFAPPEVQNSWGAYTPYFPVEHYVPPPHKCKVTQVSIIQRHGARFPTSGSGQRIQDALAKLQSASDFTNPNLFFLKNYTYSLSKNDLVPFGAYQSAEAGQETYERYSRLVSKGNIPFVRASGATRVIDSATNWTSGFADASNHIFRPVLSVILSETLNDTLEDAMCPSAGNSETQTSGWTSIYGAPIAARLNADAPGANLTAADISSLIPLCAFETVAIERLSHFCDLFTAEEFSQYEYFGDLDKYYGTGYGQPLGPVQGVGYINELIARLTRTPVRDNTQTNRTLDSSPITFPLDRSIYADFSHDNLIVAVLAAMGLFKQPQPLEPTKPDPSRTWITSQLVPFSGRMVVERMQCKDRTAPESVALSSGAVGMMMKGKEKRWGDKFVRILVNDAVQPLEFCGADEDGLCGLERFVESQGYARRDGDGDFEKCFETSR